MHAKNLADQDTLSWRERISFGSGELAANVAWNMVTGFLLFYYTDVARLPVSAMATLMLVTRILDAIIDPLVGVTVDRTRTRWGRARPYLLFACVPFGLLCVATFWIPAWSESARIIYAYVSFTVLGMVYSLLFIPYSAMLPMLSRSPQERERLASFRTIGAACASIFTYSLTLPIVEWAGRGDAQKGFIFAAAFMSSITVVLFILVFWNCRERVVEVHGDKPMPIAQGMRQMLGNGVWWIAFGIGLLIFTRIGIMVSSLAYYAKDVLGKPWVVSVMLTLLSVAILSGGVMAAPLFRHFGKAKVLIAALGLSCVPVLLMPFVEGALALLIGCFVLSQVVIGIIGSGNFAIVAEAVDVQERRNGHRMEGLLSSSISFSMKVGMAVGTALTAFTLDLTGYSPDHVVVAATNGLRLLTYGGPLLTAVLLILCVLGYRSASSRDLDVGGNAAANAHGTVPVHSQNLNN